MLAFLTRHEWTLLVSSEIVRIAAAAFGAALLLAALLGVARTSSADRAVAACECVGPARPAPSSMRAGAVADERGAMVVVPRGALAALAAGQSDVHPGYFKVTARNLDAVVSGDQIAHPLVLASGHFDVAFVLLFLYPLLIFAVSFDLTAGERDRGTLRMVLAQPVRLRDVVAGKVIARWLLLAVPTILIPLVVRVATDEAAALGTPLLLWTITVIAYGLIWHGIALVINARGWNAAANALVLAGIWLMFAIVGPATINLGIAIRYPMPSRVEAAVQARAATQDATVQGSRALGQFLQDHPTSANVGREGLRQFAMLQAARDKQVADRLQAVDVAFDQQLHRQQRLASWLSLLSPTMVAQQVLLETAGTGTSRFDHFEAQVKGFHLRWKEYFEPFVLDAATLTTEQVAAAPAFSYEDEPPSTTAWRVAPAIAGMTVAAVALIAAGMRRYEGYAL